MEPMGRYLWVWCLSWLLVVCFAAGARADDDPSTWIRVCVRPKEVPGTVNVWAYTAGNTVIVSRAAFKTKSGGLTTYAFDPYAPPENTQRLPIPHNTLP